MRRYIAISCVFLSWLMVFAGTPLENFLQSKSITPGSTSVLIQDLKSGEILVSHNDDVLLLPASIMKTVTIAGLMEAAGPEGRFHTKVYADGKIANGILAGDLLVVGGGDPTLGADCGPESADIGEEIIAAMRDRGIEKITGKIRVDTALYRGPACPPSWAAGDLNESYGTGSHALNFRRNATGSRAVKNPETVFITYLMGRLRCAGIQIGGGSEVSERGICNEESATLLVDHVSDRYSEVMRSCMMRSDNLYAETMLRAFALATGEKGATEAGARKMLSHWKKEGIPVEGVVQIDGSGLSRSNRVTARFINGILRKMGDNDEYASFMPLAGEEGTLSGFLKDTALDAYVAMKTGSMNGIQCYAGYKLDEQFAPTHTIVIIMNDIKGRPGARKAAEELLLGIFSPGAF